MTLIVGRGSTRGSWAATIPKRTARHTAVVVNVPMTETYITRQEQIYFHCSITAMYLQSFYRIIFKEIKKLRIDNGGWRVIYAVALFSIAIPVTLIYYTSNDRE